MSHDVLIRSLLKIVFERTSMRIIQVSDLSALDGRVLAYRGFDG